MQGPIYQWTLDFINRFLSHELVDKLILSTWEGEKFDWKHNRLTTIFNKKPLNPGIANRNLQIISSLKGLRKLRSGLCIKIRTDIFLPELSKMYDFWVNNDKNLIKYEKNGGPVGPIFVLGMYNKLLFHPRDHVFCGHVQDLKRLFDIPLDKELIKQYNESNDLRSETYIGMYYYAKFNSKVEKFIHSWPEYLTDNAKKWQIAKKIDDKIRDKVFRVFPKVKIEMPKHYPGGGYPWELTKELYGEYTHEDLNV